jgi:hypothetical protein
MPVPQKNRDLWNFNLGWKVVCFTLANVYTLLVLFKNGTTWQIGNRNLFYFQERIRIRRWEEGMRGGIEAIFQSDPFQS